MNDNRDIANVLTFERYKAYFNTLIGKQETDQMLYVFKNETDKNKYSSLVTDNGKNWVINITKHHMIENPWAWMSNPDYIHGGSTFYSLYMFKEKDYVVLKTCIVLPRNSRNYSNNCSTFFINLLKKKGFFKYEFTSEQANFLSFDTRWGFKTNNIKILIPNDKTEDDLIDLISMIDKFNEYVPTIEQKDWDNMPLVKEKIKFES